MDIDLFIDPCFMGSLERASQYGAEVRKSIYRLKNDYNLSAYAEKLLALATGRPTTLDASHDRRKALVPASHKKLFMGLASMFSVGDDFQYKKYRHKFSASGWREVAWIDIMRLGLGCWHLGAFTRSQVEQVLRILEKAGYIERMRFYNRGKNKSRLFIRFNAAKIMADIDMLKAEKTEVLAAKNDVKNSNVSTPIDQDTLNIKDTDSGSADAFASVADPSISGTQPKRGNLTVDKILVDLETNPALEIGEPDFRAVTAEVQDIFRDEPLNLKHVAKLRCLFYSGVGKNKMTLVDLKKYHALRDQSAGYSFVYDCDLEFFLKAWPTILVTLRREEIKSNVELRQTDELLDAIAKTDGDLVPIAEDRLQKLKTLIERTGCPGYLQSMRGPYEVFHDYIALKYAGLDEWASRALNGYADDLKKRLKEHSLLALEIRRKCPAIIAELGFTKYDWNDIVRHVNRSREFLMNLRNRADFFGVDISAPAVVH